MIRTTTMGEILREEFLNPMQITVSKLARDINVPLPYITDILNNRKKMDVDTSIRLGRYFGVSDMYFARIENDIEFRNQKLFHVEDYVGIIPH